ncbi:hypothetical protein B0O99DRAFT_604653 [Bisporella sp. PMI_857]|nr:hypothetical protein B0O99DRAFT_604653 [Bisporella sp. PMI_857]
MSGNYFTSYSLRDLFRMGYSTRRHRSSTRSSYPTQNPYQYSNYTKSTSYPRNDKPYLSNLPPEIQLSIFDTLDPVSSTCLGLTSKKFYPLHRSAHKNVGLYDQSSEKGLPLCYLLKDWAPNDMVLDWRSEKLVSRDRYGDLGRESVRKERDKDRRVGWQPREYRESKGWRDERKERYCLHPDYEPYYEPSKPRLRRSRRLDRHDIWYGGRRY